MTYLRSSSSSYYFEFKKAKPRSWNAAKYSRGYEYSRKRFDLQHAQRDSDELHNDSRTLAISLAILRTEGIENSEERKTIAINTFTLLFNKKKEKKSRRQISLMSMAHHAVGIETCSQSMTFPSYLSSERHLQNFLVRTENFRAGS